MSTNSFQPWESPAESSAKVDRLRRDVAAAWSPPPRISVPAWADEYRRLAAGFGAVSGRWATEAFEIARGPMLAVTEPGVHEITLMCCTQLLKTEFILNVFGYLAHLDPSPILILQPKDDAAEQFSKERLQPTIDATPVLREKVGGSDETLTYKPFPGGFVALAGAGSPDNVARRPIRAYLADEVDKYRFTREGNTLLLAGERTAQFGLNWLGVQACSPTVEDESIIAECYYGKDQKPGSDRRLASVECPHCAHRQFLDFFKHVQWDKRTDDKGQVREHLWKTAKIHCECCGAQWSEAERLRSLKTIRWHQTKPFECCGERQVPLDTYEKAWRLEDTPAALDAAWVWWEDKAEGRYAVYRATCGKCGSMAVDNSHAGFQASKLFSPSPKDKPSNIAAKWLSAKGKPDDELVWWNTQMGLPHRPHGGKTLAVDALLARREQWEAEVPDGVGVATMGVDVQDYRVEYERVGWGRDEESWSIEYGVIEGELSDPMVQKKLDEVLQESRRDRFGRPYKVMAACIDSGGHHTQAVYAFCKARLGRHVWAVKGASERDGARNPVWPTKKPSKRNKAAFRPVVIGGNSARDTIRNRLMLDPPAPGQPKPGYAHFPADRDVGYFEQLIADRLEVKEVSQRKIRVWITPAGKANEAADCRVYAYAALCGLNHFGLQLNRRVDQVARAPEVVEVPIAAAALVAANAAAAAPQKRSLISRLA